MNIEELTGKVNSLKEFIKRDDISDDERETANEILVQLEKYISDNTPAEEVKPQVEEPEEPEPKFEAPENSIDDGQTLLAFESIIERMITERKDAIAKMEDKIKDYNEEIEVFENAVADYRLRVSLTSDKENVMAQWK